MYFRGWNEFFYLNHSHADSLHFRFISTRHSISVSLSSAPTTDGLDLHSARRHKWDDGQQHSSLSVLFNFSIYNPIPRGYREATGLDVQYHPGLSGMGRLKPLLVFTHREFIKKKNHTQQHKFISCIWINTTLNAQQGIFSEQESVRSNNVLIESSLRDQISQIRLKWRVKALRSKCRSANSI